MWVRPMCGAAPPRKLGSIAAAKINTRIESLERRIQEAEAAEVNEMVRTAKVTPEQIAALLRQSATSTPTRAALSAVGATIDKEESDNEDALQHRHPAGGLSTNCG